MATATAAGEIDFNRDIRPILSENCFHCHGPDAAHRQADLRLDTEQGAHAALDLQSPAESLLLQRVSTTDPDLLMPPPASNRKLTPRQIELLTQWVAAGAPWGQHWAFQPIVAPPLPVLQLQPDAPVTARNEIDLFIQAQLQREGLTPAREADRRTLLRRLSLDLTGLPPTPAELAEFLNDSRPDAYERQVDRLLNSPAYGERMAWEWLDAARYADSNGYQGDGERTMWPWRDWVVRAFNENLPYDQFTVWQLAGDLLPEATFEQQLATGFCRNHMINGEGGRIAEENRVDYVMDMSETMGTVWLGLTLNCCRCHDHKFDELTKHDYFALFAYFNQTPVDGGGGNPQTPPVLAVPTAAQRESEAALLDQLRTLDRERDAYAQQVTAQQAEWESARLSALRQADPWQPLAIRSASALHQELQLLPDGSLLAGGPNPATDTYTLLTSSPLKSLQSLRLDVLRHPGHTQGGLARSDSGNFVLTEIELAVRRAGAEEFSPVPIATAQASFEQGGLSIDKAFDGKPGTGWAVYEGKPIDRDHAAVFQLREPLELQPEDALRVILRHDSPHTSHNIGRFQLSVAATRIETVERPERELLTLLQIPAAERTAAQQQQLRERFLADDESWQGLQQRREGVQKQLNDLRNSFPKVMVMQDRPEPRTTYVLDRGLYSEPGEVIEPRTPAALPPLPEGAPRNRLALAQWLVSAEQPLTPRVTVNRFWQQLFGTGLVKTAEDFGVQGEVPVHLDLLNWLAADFRAHGWDVKRLIRQLVTSHTYRQSSQVTPELWERDPANRLLARAPRYRWPFWMLRDQALAASGLLVNTPGGPPVNSYQPAGVWEEATFGGKRYVQDHGDALYRRSLYIFWRRIIAPTMFFDSASRQTCSVKPLRSNTPLHALLTFNDVTYVEAARRLAEHALLEAGLETDAARLEWLYQRLLARGPAAAEEDILLRGLTRSRGQYRENRAAAQALVATGEAPLLNDADPAELASWTSLCLALMNLDEFLTKE
jgi:hypothetical protein